MRVREVALLTLLVACLTFGPDGVSGASQTHVIFRIHMTGPMVGWGFWEPEEQGSVQLLYTGDGGLHWTDITPVTPPREEISEPVAIDSHRAWVETCTPLRVVGTGAVQSCTLLGTVNGGQEWTAVGSLPDSQGDLQFLDARHGWLMVTEAAAGSEDTWIYRTIDGGRTWLEVASGTYRSQDNGLPFAGDKTGIVFRDTLTGWVTGYSAGGCSQSAAYLFVTHDGGYTWRHQILPAPPRAPRQNRWTKPPTFFSVRDGVLPAVFEDCDDEKVATIFYATHDGGQHWVYTAPVPVHGSGPSSFSDTQHGWITEGSTLYRTWDGGKFWTRIPLPPQLADIKQLDFVSSEVGWATRETAPYLLKTVDGGKNWTPLI